MVEIIFGQKLMKYCLLLALVLFICQNSVLFAKENNNFIQNGWGIRIALPAGKDADNFNLNIEKLVNNLSVLKTPKWVMINLTQDSYGGRFTSPSRWINDNIGEECCPQYDYFGKAIYELKKNKFKVLVYYSLDGGASPYLFDNKQIYPSRIELKKDSNNIMLKWKKYLNENKMSDIELIAKIIEIYSLKYKNSIDGWWFDYGSGKCNSIIKNAALSGNKKSILTWNDKHKLDKNGVWLLTDSCKFSAYTDGHVTPTRKINPWNAKNEAVIDQIESLKNGVIGDNIAAHFFLPLQQTWRGGSVGFPESMLKNWTYRIIVAGAGVTWAVALEPPEYTKSFIQMYQYNQLLRLDKWLLDMKVISCR